MVWLAVAVLFLLAVVNYLLSRSLVFPSVAFCSVWVVDLFLIQLAGDMFYPLSARTLTIYCVGAVAFSVGSFCAQFFPCKPVKPRPAPRSLNWLLALVAIGGIYVYQWSVGLSSGINAVSSFAAVRMAMVEQGVETDLPSKVAMEIIGLAVIVAMICFYEVGRKRKLFALLLALLLVLLTGSRSASIILILSITALDWFKHKRIRWKLVGTMAIIALIVFAGVAVLLANGSIDPNTSLADNIAPIKDVFLLYAAGGAVGFDRVVRDPNIIPHNWQVENPILLILNKFGAHFYIPTQHADFLVLGPHSLLSNVYTMYFSFIDWGITGILALTFLAGFMAAIFYQRAVNGHKTSAIIYGYMFAACILSVFAQYFFDVNFLAKLALVSWCVYSLPDFLWHLGRLASRIVENGTLLEVDKRKA